MTIDGEECAGEERKRKGMPVDAAAARAAAATRSILLPIGANNTDGNTLSGGEGGRGEDKVRRTGQNVEQKL